MAADGHSDNIGDIGRETYECSILARTPAQASGRISWVRGREVRMAVGIWRGDDEQGRLDELVTREREVVGVPRRKGYSVSLCIRPVGMYLCMWGSVSGGPTETRESARGMLKQAGEGKAADWRYGAKRGRDWPKYLSGRRPASCGAVATKARTLKFSSHGPSRTRGRQPTPDMAGGSATDWSGKPPHRLGTGCQCTDDMSDLCC